MNNSVFEKTIENVWIHRDIKLVTTKKKESTIWCPSKLSYCKVFHRNFFDYRNENAQRLMNKPVYLELSVLELSKKVMHELWYD